MELLVAGAGRVGDKQVEPPVICSDDHQVTTGGNFKCVGELGLTTRLNRPGVIEHAPIRRRQNRKLHGIGNLTGRNANNSDGSCGGRGRNHERQVSLTPGINRDRYTIEGDRGIGET